MRTPTVVTHNILQGTTVTAATTPSGKETVAPEPQRTTANPSTHYGWKLPAQRGAVATEMNKITPVIERNNAR